jgi:septal ring factor EnvC (AmiA/AmiB activator)
VDVLTSRADAAQQEVERQRGSVNGMRVEISTLRTEVSTLRRENTALSGQLAQRNRTVGSLQRTVRAREEELAALRRDGASAEVHGMPRRVLSSDDATEVAGIVDRGTLDTAMVLPNYEMDRQLA